MAEKVDRKIEVVTSETMTAFVDKKLGVPAEAAKAEPAKEAPKVEAKAEEEEGTDAEKEQRKKDRLNKRFSELTADIKKAEAETAKERDGRLAAERRAAEAEAKLNPPKKDEDAEPQPDQFQDPKEYAKSYSEWSVRKAMKERDEKEAKDKAVAEAEAIAKTWQERVTATQAELPDYTEKISRSEVVVSDQVRDAILDSDIGPKILYHLAENPDVAKRISELPVRKAIKAIGRLEAKLEGTSVKEAPKSEEKIEPKVEISRAPAPITPLKGASAPVGLPVDSQGRWTGSHQEYKEARRAGKIK